jgi:hypothetical protein
MNLVYSSVPMLGCNISVEDRLCTSWILSSTSCYVLEDCQSIYAYVRLVFWIVTSLAMRAFCCLKWKTEVPETPLAGLHNLMFVAFQLLVQKLLINAVIWTQCLVSVSQQAICWALKYCLIDHFEFKYHHSLWMRNMEGRKIVQYSLR